MFRPRSLRTTVTLWHMSALLIVLLAYAVAVFVFVRRNLSSALDLRTRVAGNARGSRSSALELLAPQWFLHLELFPWVC